MRAAPSSKPLSGLLVVSLEQAVAAPFCSAKFADAGARVIKLERPEGDFARGYDTYVKGLSSYFVWLNRGKESLVIDIKAQADAALLHRILGKADVFIQNLAPGASARAGFGSAELRRRYPRLVTCDISGYGEEGPYRDMKAYDLLVQVESGLAAVTGTPEAPGRVGVSICDISTGLTAYSAILEALNARERSGQGSAVQVSLYDVIADWLSPLLLQYFYAGKATPRVGISHHSIAPYGAYATKGEPIVISIQNEREWHAFCEGVLERPELTRDARFATPAERAINRAALDKEIAAVFTSLERDALVARLKRFGTAFGNLNSIESASRHPQLRRTTVASEAGAIELIAPPIRRAGEPAEPLGKVPARGEHSAAIRREFAEG
ncbi:MAG TPA: CaiB/BaiF CoA-transferase family protein [Alphaproteobacteria bacterium]|nr:CaiB/BaiF CoA-transferase family protein [Alphaproteobacteria bacterium]